MRTELESKRGRPLTGLNRSDDRLREDIGGKAGVSPFQLQTILVPIDFSTHSEKALEYALPFAKQFGAQIVLLHVVEPRTFPNPSGFIARPEIIEENIARLNAREEKLLEFSRKRIERGIKSAAIVQLGKACEEIVNLAKARRVDLVILATNGHGGREKPFLGRTTERVIRHAPCPVLVVREKERDFISSAGISDEAKYNLNEKQTDRSKL